PLSSRLTSPRPAPHRPLPSSPTRRSSDLTRPPSPFPLPRRSVTNPEPYSVGPRHVPCPLDSTDVRIPKRGTWGGDHACRVLGCRSEEHTSELQSRGHLVCRLLLEKKKAKH